MAKPTNPRQPVVYIMMLLADSLVTFRQIGRVGLRDRQYCEHQKNVEMALTMIRCLSEFMSAPGGAHGRRLIKITDSEFGGVADKSFLTGHFDRISKYVSHLSKQRYMKEAKYPRPTASTAMTAGKQILKAMRTVMDPHKNNLKGVAIHWYTVFEDRYRELFEKDKTERP